MMPATVQDRHLDVLLSMALEQMDQEENERIIQAEDPQIDTDVALRLDQTYAFAYQSARQEKKRNQRIVRGRKAARGLRLAAAALGVIVALALAAFPVALAASAEFRGRVMKMFIELEESEGIVRYHIFPTGEEDETTINEAPNAPKHWRGLYYPQYIPESFTQSAYDDVLLSVTYTAPSGQRFTFLENVGSMPLVDPPEGSYYILEWIQDGDYPVVEEPVEGGGSRITVTWEIENRWLRLIAENMEREEVLRIADSTASATVQSELNRDVPMVLPLAVSDKVPDWWRGRYFPSVLPEDMWIQSFSVNDYVQFCGENDAYIDYTEGSKEWVGSGVFALQGSEVQNVLINGREGTMIVIGEEDVRSITLFWQTEDAMIELRTHRIGIEETIRIAEGVVPCERNPGDYTYIHRDDTGSAVPPREWTGQFFPAQVPEGFFLNGINTDQSSIQLTHLLMMQTIEFQELLLRTPRIPPLETVESIRLADVNGCQALLFSQRAEDNEMQELSLYWEISSEMWLSLKTSGLPEETLLQIAGSIRKTTPMVQAEE